VEEVQEVASQSLVARVSLEVVKEAAFYNCLWGSERMAAGLLLGLALSLGLELQCVPLGRALSQALRLPCRADVCVNLRVLYVRTIRTAGYEGEGLELRG
jgi:hypothetical protein